MNNTKHFTILALLTGVGTFFSFLPAVSFSARETFGKNLSTYFGMFLFLCIIFTALAFNSKNKVDIANGKIQKEFDLKKVIILVVVIVLIGFALISGGFGAMS